MVLRLESHNCTPVSSYENLVTKFTIFSNFQRMHIADISLTAVVYKYSFVYIYKDLRIKIKI